jgi:hypothetical protein
MEKSGTAASPPEGAAAISCRWRETLQLLESSCDLLRDRERFLDGDETPGYSIGGRRAFHELEHERFDAVRLFIDRKYRRCWDG